MIPDCLDSSDEDLTLSRYFQQICRRDGDPSFRCSEVMCQHWLSSEEDVRNPLCGGVVYSREKRDAQMNQQLLVRSANQHINEECWATMICLTWAQQRIVLVSRAYSFHSLRSLLERYHLWISIQWDV